MAKCKTCGAPVNLAPDGDPKYQSPAGRMRAKDQAQAATIKTLVDALEFYRDVVTTFASETDMNADVAEETLDRDRGNLARAALAAAKEAV